MTPIPHPDYCKIGRCTSVPNFTPRRLYTAAMLAYLVAGVIRRSEK